MNNYDLYEFVPLTEDLYNQAETTDYEEAVERLERGWHITMIERCLADCCEIIGNNTDTYEEALEMIHESGDILYPLSEWSEEARVEIYNQWLEHFNHPINRTTEEQMKAYIEGRKTA